MNSPLFQILTDFSAPQPAEAPILALLKPTKPAKTVESASDVPAKPKLDPAAEQAEAIRKAVEAVRAEEREVARREIAAALEAEKARHQEELAGERLQWAETEGEQLGARFGAAFESLETLVSERVANVLGPFVAEAYRRQMIADFRTTVKSILADALSGTLRVTGPVDLLAALKTSLGGELGSIEFQVSETVDVCVVASDTAVDTLLKPWSDRLSDVLKAD